MKVELHTFEGRELLGWISKAEKSVKLQRINLRRRSHSFISMERVVVRWFRFLQTKIPELSWEGLTEALIQRIEDRSMGNVLERSATPRQAGPVEYVPEFEVLGAQTSAITEEQLLGHFLGRLRPEVKCRAQTHNPKDISKVITLARDVEEELCVVGDIEESQFQAPMSGYKQPSSGGIVTHVGSVKVGPLGLSSITHG